MRVERDGEQVRGTCAGSMGREGGGQTQVVGDLASGRSSALGTTSIGIAARKARRECRTEICSDIGVLLTDLDAFW